MVQLSESRFSIIQKTTKLKETNAQIVSFEPLNEAFQDLKKIELKNLNRLKVFNYAIGEKNETLEL